MRSYDLLLPCCLFFHMLLCTPADTPKSRPDSHAPIGVMGDHAHLTRACPFRRVALKKRVRMEIYSPIRCNWGVVLLKPVRVLRFLGIPETGLMVANCVVCFHFIPIPENIGTETFSPSLHGAHDRLTVGSVSVVEFSFHTREIYTVAIPS